jgi:hypothetical protein
VHASKGLPLSLRFFRLGGLEMGFSVRLEFLWSNLDRGVPDLLLGISAPVKGLHCSLEIQSTEKHLPTTESPNQGLPILGMSTAVEISSISSSGR